VQQAAIVRLRETISMYDNNMPDARDALREARDCCERIASVLDHTHGEAEQIGDQELLERLAAAKAAASRAGELIDKLAVLLDREQPNSRQ
jgi:hypothetical protein